MNSKAIMIAAVQGAGLFGAGLLIPVLGQMVSLFTPVPFILLAVRHGLNEGLAAVAAASLVVTAFAGWQAGLILFLGFGLMALGISWGMRRGLRPEHAVLLGGVLPVAAAAVPLALAMLQQGLHPVAAAEGYLKASIQEAVSLYQGMGLTEMADKVTGMSETFVHYFVRLLPGMVLATSLVQTACCYGVSRMVLLRRPGPGPDLSAQPGLGLWHGPDAWVWGLIAALGLAAVPHETLRFLGMNIGLVYLVLYTVQGMAVVEFLLKKAGLNGVLRALFQTLILMLPSNMLLPPLGVVDIWADFRKVRAPEKQE